MKKRNIKNYKRKSDDTLLQAIKENNTQKQPKNNKRIDSIGEDFKNLSHKLSKSELKEIKNDLFNIEKQNNFIQKRLINALMI